ncbi:enoyl-CoA hydratase-related protein [Pontixanthobacter aestiaquae]|uniref:Enoyl-CoA hydratase/isomerase family protein n=1 Tax=Pontixanthobacter aestiaquae TaxID=1509367 RepID=A0A844Z5Q6_9SPHN|nr:enoyl-CoA hydratase-related protein [Pontixanthobacter aestiaquae]MDN3645888.1 enoyl-CoA hydratase-related protein [Pontixanthobacter aestiaquae]MXO83118.1 enoyl-CoA hydratase/isomerase family protein [Pontixanthobacter aestiaquae]
MTIRFERDGAIGSLLIDRADRRNAITLGMWQTIPALLDKVEAEPGLRVLIVKSAEGGAFSVGADIAEMVASKDDAPWLADNQAAISEAQHRLAQCPIPTIAFVEGDCIGGGCAIALACDIRIATPAARFGITPAKLGLVYPFHDVKLLTDLVGPGQAKRLLYTGDLIGAKEAERIGLVEIIADSPDHIAETMAANSSVSNRIMKQMTRRILGGQIEEDLATRDMFAAAFESDDFAEGTAAFIEKRKPKFTG